MTESATSRAGVAAVASSIVPGTGQIMTGRRRLGMILLGVDAVLLGTVVIVYWWQPSHFLQAWVTPEALLAIMIGNLGVLIYRGTAAANSFLEAGRRRWFDWPLGVVAAALVIVPHLWVTGLVIAQNNLLHEVFGGNDPAIAAAPESTTTSIKPAPTSGAVPATTVTTFPTTTTTTPPRIWDGKERLNIMLLGSDAGVGRIGTRTDTVILVSVEPESGDVAMFSVPRNLTEAPLPEGMGRWDCDCFPDIITHLWANAEWYPEAFPGPQEPPINALKGALGLIFDIDVHYYAKVDLAGFVAMFDAIGGVTIDVPKRIVDPIYPSENGGTEYIEFNEGTQHLDGHHALAYARIRRNSGDFARMHRQRCLIGEAIEQTGIMDILANYGELATAVSNHVETDIPLGRLGDLVDLMTRVETDRFGTLRITRYNYGSSGHAGYQLYDLEQIQADAKTLMADPTTHLATQDGEGFDATCEESFD